MNLSFTEKRSIYSATLNYIHRRLLIVREFFNFIYFFKFNSSQKPINELGLVKNTQNFLVSKTQDSKTTSQKISLKSPYAKR